MSVEPLESHLERLSAMSPSARHRLLEVEARKHGLSPARLQAMLLRSWRFVGRPKQQPPDGDWIYWWLRSGRGFGKTLSAAQWAKDKALARRCRFGLIAPIRGDIRATMVEGESGLLSVLPAEALLGQSREHAWNRTTLELTLANDTIFSGFSSERPDRLRGPELDYVWGEEVSSWDDANVEPTRDHTTWSNMQMTLRAALDPRVCLTSTPKVNKLTKYLAGMPAGRMRMVTGSSWENRSNLSDVWWDEVIVPILGTRTGRQEIEGELLEDVEGALWTLAQIEELRVDRGCGAWTDEARRGWKKAMRRIVVSVDPNTTSGEAANDAGVIVAGRGRHEGSSEDHGFVLDDRTQTRGGPRAWAQAAVDAYYEWEADAIVAEVNNGGEMVEEMILHVDPTVPVIQVRASRGKRTRAEPAAALYASDPEHDKPGRVHHVGVFTELEDEQTTWTPQDESPNRMDAVVWALHDLKLSEAPARPYRRGQGVTKARIPTAADRFPSGGW